MKIHAARGLATRALLLLAALVAAGCDLAARPDVERLVSARTADGQALELPHSWPRGTFVQGQAIQVPFHRNDLSDSVGVFLGPTSVVFRATVNGTFVYENGDAESPGINYSSYRARPSFRIPASLLKAGENVLEFRVFSSPQTHYYEFGRVYVGGDDAIERTVVRWFFAFHVGPMMIGIVLLAVGLVALGLWRGRRDSELFLLLASGSLLWALQIGMYQSPTRLLPWPHWSVIVLALYAWFPALIGIFFLRFAYRRSRILERFAIALAVVAAPLLYAGFHFDAAPLVSIALRFCVLVFISIALVALLLYALQLRTVTGYTLFAMGAICVAVAIRDYVLSLLPGTDEMLALNPYSGVALLLFAGWMLLERYHKAYADFEMLNRDLEYRVDQANIELHRRLEQVEAARAAAEQANVAKSRFFAAASHDLRQPLHSLGLFASALRDVVGTDQGRDVARRVGDSIGALDRLFDELLDVSRLDAGVVEVRRSNLALQPMFDRLDSEFSNDASIRGLRLRFVPTRLAVNSDRTLLERVLRNLVSNALRYTQAGGVLVGARRRGPRVVVQVWDTGVGIADDQRSLIFDEFYQVGNPGRDRRKGLGLGLAIVRRLTVLLDHPLGFRSVVGRGSCFEVSLPAADGPVESGTADDSAATHAAFSGARALVVDDDLDICEATRRLLQSWGLEVRTVRGPEDALAAVREGFVPSVLLVDLRLGESVDGVGVVERLRKLLGASVPALLISGDTGARELTRVKESGLMLLTKPVAPARLRSALHALLAPIAP
ncbi:MAG TPA: hybrid sensor histidine kinase/response regulator [Burkholderiaceae bacterium]|nr:hybrid sensor histidine kinase/response regulator [Burkholderiaceae bacterium]